MKTHIAGVDFVHRALSLVEVGLAPVHAGSDDVVVSYGVVTAAKYGVVLDGTKIEPGRQGFVSNFASELSRHRCWDREKGLTSKIAF